MPNKTILFEDPQYNNTMDSPFARQGHVAIVYKTYSYEECTKFVHICDETSTIKEMSCDFCKEDNG